MFFKSNYFTFFYKYFFLLINLENHYYVILKNRNFVILKGKTLFTICYNCYVNVLEKIESTFLKHTFSKYFFYLVNVLQRNSCLENDFQFHFNYGKNFYKYISQCT